MPSEADYLEEYGSDGVKILTHVLGLCTREGPVARGEAIKALMRFSDRDLEDLVRDALHERGYSITTEPDGEVAFVYSGEGFPHHMAGKDFKEAVVKLQRAYRDQWPQELNDVADRYVVAMVVPRGHGVKKGGPPGPIDDRRRDHDTGDQS